MKSLIYLLLSLSVFTNLFAQNYNLKFEKLENYPDVPYSDILNIVQDSEGFIWTHTAYELFRFDGNRFISFSKFQQESDFPFGTLFLTLFIDSHKILWVGTNKGIFMRNDTLDYFKQITPPISLSESNIEETFHGIVEDTVTGKYYFLAENGIIYSYERSGSFKSLLNLELAGCKFITIDSKQNLWIASSNQIFKYNINNNFTRQINLEPGNNIELIEITELLIDDSILYMTAYKSDLIKYNLNTGKTEFLSQNVNQNTYCLLKDKAGFIWIGSNLGLKCLNPVTNKLSIYLPSERNIKSISSPVVNCLFIDRQENFWVGTENGLNVSYHLNKFNAFGKKFGNLPFSCDVAAITSDYKGNIWLGYRKGGIQILDPDFNIIESINSYHGLKPNTAISGINFFYEDEERSMWIGTYQNGLLVYNPHTKIIQQLCPDKNQSSIQGSFVISLCADKKENFWLAIHGYGIEYFIKAEERFTNFLDHPSEYPISIRNNWPFSINMDSKDNLWVGSTYGAVCYNLITGIYRVYNTESEITSKISNNFVGQIYEDSDHRIWLGTSYGLNVIFNDQTTRIISTSDGLSSNQIRSIVEDCKGDIWIGTINGLNKITEVTEDKLTVETYNKEDGLHNNCFLDNSAFKSNDGHLFFGGIDGFTVFHPDSIEYNREPPKVVFTEFRLFNKKVGVVNPGQLKKTADNQFQLEKNIQFLDKIKLNEKQNLISFLFASLNYINPSNNHYAYKLEGFDQDWIYSGNRNSAEYSNLTPGNYTLLVKATNNDGIWCKEDLSIDIEVIPTFWKSRFASILYILLLISIIFLIINTVREREVTKLQSEQKELLINHKTQFFINVAHEIKTPLTLISLPLKKLLEQNQKSNSITVKTRELKTVYRNVLRLLRIVMQILDFRKIELNKVQFKVARYDIVPFIHSVIQYFEYQAVENKVNIQFNYERDKDLSFYFDPDKMDKILYNILSNAMRYSPEHATILINISSLNKKGRPALREIPYIKIEIEDEGPGISADRLNTIYEPFGSSESESSRHREGSGIGLSIAKEFTELHNGSIQVISPCKANGQDTKPGTKVILMFPSNDMFLQNEQITKSIQRHEEIILENQLTVVDHYAEEEVDEEFELQGILHSPAYRILIIEDDPELRELMRNDFGIYHELIEARDGESGLRTAKDIIPDLIISDILLPGISGYDLLTALKQAVETSHIPIILLTAKTTQNDEIEAYAKGADAFVRKPFNLKTLLHLAESLIENRLKLKKQFLSSYGIELRKAVPTHTDEKFIERLLKLINDHISDPKLGVALFTRELGMSRAQLYKKVNAITNTSVKLFIRKIRLKKAAQLLKEENFTITEISYAVGFDSLPYFSKCFHEEFGLSPSKYAESINPIKS